MKSTSVYICLAIAILTSISRAQDKAADGEGPYEIQPIRSLDDIQGHWVFVPKGAGSFGGLVLDIEGKKGVLKEVSDIPVTTAIEVGIELAGGALILKSDSPGVPKGKWNLATFGEYKCLVRLYGRNNGKSRQPSLWSESLYLYPPKEGEQAEGAKKPKPAK